MRSVNEINTRLRYLINLYTRINYDNVKDYINIEIETLKWVLEED